MVSLKKINYVGEVPFKDKPGGNVIGTARLEKLKSGSLIAHVDMAGNTADILREGFSFGLASFGMDE